MFAGYTVRPNIERVQYFLPAGVHRSIDNVRTRSFYYYDRHEPIHEDIKTKFGFMAGLATEVYYSFLYSYCPALKCAYHGCFCGFYFKFRSNEIPEICLRYLLDTIICNNVTVWQALRTILSDYDCLGLNIPSKLIDTLAPSIDPHYTPSDEHPRRAIVVFLLTLYRYGITGEQFINFLNQYYFPSKYDGRRIEDVIVYNEERLIWHFDEHLTTGVSFVTYCSAFDYEDVFGADIRAGRRRLDFIEHVSGDEDDSDIVSETSEELVMSDGEVEVEVDIIPDAGDHIPVLAFHENEAGGGNDDEGIPPDVNRRAFVDNNFVYFENNNVNE